MAANDFALLVGVSSYLDGSTFRPLKGPPLELQLMRSWLTDPRGGAVPKSQVLELKSPVKPAAVKDHAAWKPRPEQFGDMFRRLTSSSANGPHVQRNGRLYLYFSGHGFSRYSDKELNAALFMASATRGYPDHVWGTSYAHRARDLALFSEVVLIMDCCRDEEFNFALTPATVNESRDESGGTRLLAIYAAPQGGKAQEREFKELKGRTCGLLTFALLKALRETPTDAEGRLSSASLKNHMEDGWAALCGDVPADPPSIYGPPSGEIYFTGGNAGVRTAFRLYTPGVKQLRLEIQDFPGAVWARCTVDASLGTVTVEYPQGPQETVPLVEGRFSVMLQPNFYRCVLSGDRVGTLPIEARSVGADVEL